MGTSPVVLPYEYAVPSIVINLTSEKPQLETPSISQHVRKITIIESVRPDILKPRYHFKVRILSGDGWTPEPRACQSLLYAVGGTH
jgi:hypothetical protein